MLHSLLSQDHGARVEVAFLHGPDMRAGQRSRLAGMVDGLGGRIDFVEVNDPRLDGLRPMHWAPPATWYRVFLPELLPDEDRIVYLDTDTIVLDSLAPLRDLDLGGRQQAAVTNVLMREHEHRIELLDLPERRSYFNCGVMVINLERWRSDGATQALLDFALENPYKIGWGDQDAINVVLPDRVPLHPRWNCTNAIMAFPWGDEVIDAAELELARREPAIRHFEGPTVNKPWHLLCEQPMRELYFEHRRETPWPHCRRQGMTPANLARWLRRKLL
jgi:lipopolysaccharide biosynthesis glycosyltransferase